MLYRGLYRGDGLSQGIFYKCQSYTETMSNSRRWFWWNGGIDKSCSSREHALYSPMPTLRWLLADRRGLGEALRESRDRSWRPVLGASGFGITDRESRRGFTLSTVKGVR